MRLFTKNAALQYAKGRALYERPGRLLTLFRDPRYRLLWINVVLSDMGFIMFVMVHGWLALILTDSPFWVGATAGVQGLGILGASTIVGVLVDRLNRVKLIRGAQLLQAAMLLVMAILVLTGHDQLWQVLIIGFLHGLAVAVRTPARMALTLDVVGRGRLLSATAANFAAMAIIGIVAPLLAGAVVSIANIGWAYVIMGGAYCGAATVLFGLKVETRGRRMGGETSSPWSDFKQGFRYVSTTPIIRTLILMALVCEVFGWAHESMLPVMARDELKVGAAGLGYLLAAASGGGLTAMLVLSSLGDLREKGRLLVGGYGGFGLFLALFAASRWFPPSMVLLALAYAAAVMYETAISTLLQTVVPDEMRGRVLSFQVFTWGLTGVSGFLTGAVALALGAPVAIAIGGGVLLLNAARLAGLTSRFRGAVEEAGD